MLSTIFERYLLAKVHGTIAICMGTAGGFDEEYCGQMMVVSPIVWRFTSTGSEAASGRNPSHFDSNAGCVSCTKHGHPGNAGNDRSNLPVSSKTD
ncbi:hypothetical protein TNCV_3789711 [Trichonephila clavipes]|nr:hypothetical protein TNCV_3789711 [Trichonephila clavipes]